MNSYIQDIWNARYFWWHLAMADLRARWRHSYMGMLWSFIQPLCMTLILSIVFSRLFHVDIVQYAPYILSGIIVWEFVGASLTGGCLAFVQSEPYIKQCKHPLAIYTLRLIIGNLVVLCISSIALLVWAIVLTPHNIGWTWLSLLTFYPVMALMAWPLATLLAYVSTRFRDIPHAMGLLLQIIWFMSPVYFEEKMFRNGGLNALIDYNPVYHVLQIIRSPVLENHWPTFQNYAYSLLAALIFATLAVSVGRKAESKVIFYL